jgi:hypothetical protein
MKKLKLDVEGLTVDSFATAADAVAQPGTVEAQEIRPTLRTVCGNETWLVSNPTCCPCTPMF